MAPGCDQRVFRGWRVFAALSWIRLRDHWLHESDSKFLPARSSSAPFLACVQIAECLALWSRKIAAGGPFRARSGEPSQQSMTPAKPFAHARRHAREHG